MSTANLKAVDQVVKIVRELDRYGGAFAAEWARPEPPRLDAPAAEDVAFAKAWLQRRACAGRATIAAESREALKAESARKSGAPCSRAP